MIENPVISGRNKYVELDCHFVRDHYKLKNITVRKIDGVNQRVDLLTKNLVRPTHGSTETCSDSKLEACSFEGA